MVKLDQNISHHKAGEFLWGLIDNCPVHPQNSQTKLKAIELSLSSSNKTSKLQPLDQILESTILGSISNSMGQFLSKFNNFNFFNF